MCLIGVVTAVDAVIPNNTDIQYTCVYSSFDNTPLSNHTVLTGRSHFQSPLLQERSNFFKSDIRRLTVDTGFYY